MGGTGKPSLSRLALGLAALAEDWVRGTGPGDRPDLGRAAQGCHSDVAAFAVGTCQRAACGLRELGRRAASVAVATAAPAVYAGRVALPVLRVPDVLDGPLTHARTSARYMVESLVTQGHTTMANARAEVAALLPGGRGGDSGDNWSQATTPPAGGRSPTSPAYRAWDPSRDQVTADTAAAVACSRSSATR